MKHLNMFLAISCLSFIACHRMAKSSPVNSEEDSIEVTSSTMELMAWEKYDWHSGADTIIGCFDGKGIDTLVSEPVSELVKDEYDAGWFWHVRCLSGRLPALELEDHKQRMSCRLVAEGDLDGNGTDEFGVLSDYLSNWEVYFIYTYSQTKWNYMTEPIPVFEGFLEDNFQLEDVVSASRKPNYIQVCMSEYKDPDFIITDTLFRVKMYPIE